MPWPCRHEFLAIVTHPRIYADRDFELFRDLPVVNPLVVRRHALATGARQYAIGRRSLGSAAGVAVVAARVTIGDAKHPPARRGEVRGRFRIRPPRW